MFSKKAAKIDKTFTFDLTLKFRLSEKHIKIYAIFLMLCASN